MEDHAADATPPSDGPASTNAEAEDDGMPSSSERSDATEETGAGGDGRADRSSPPEAEAVGGDEASNGESNGESSSSSGDAPPAAGHDGEVPTAKTRGEDDTAKSPEGEAEPEQGEAEEYVILPNLAADPIILPAKSVQTQAEAIQGEDHGDVEDESPAEEQPVQRGDDVEDHHADPVDDSFGNDRPEADDAAEKPSRVSTYPIPAESSEAAIDDPALDNTEELERSANDVNGNMSGSENDTARQTSEHAKIYDEDGPSSDVQDDANANGRQEDRPSGSETSQQSTTHDTERDDAVDATESTQDSAGESSDAKTDNQTVESSTESNSSTSSDAEHGAPAEGGNATTGNADKKGEQEGKDEDNDGPRQINLVDYASKLAGAQILEQSSSLKGASNLLTSDKDKYSIAPCEDKKYVVIGLSEDILVKQIKLSNYERYSSRVRRFQVLASQEYPSDDAKEEYWNSVGTYVAEPKSGEQVFDLDEPAWARYLKFRFVSHYGSEHYCTLTRVKVHGSTMLQGFHEQWIESEKKDQEQERGQDEESPGEEFEGEVEVAGGEEGGKEEMHDKSSLESDQSEETADEDVPDQGGDDGSSEEVRAHDEQPKATEKLDRNEEVSVLPTDTGAEDIQAEAVQGEERNAKSVPESQQGMDDLAESKGEDAELVAVEKKPDHVDKTSPEANTDGPAQSEDESRDLNEQKEEGENKQSHTSQLHGDSTPTPNAEDDGNEMDRERRAKTQTSTRETITTDGGAAMRNDSSIAGVTGVVKAAVADASDAIINATSDAIKKIRTTVSSAKTESADVGDAITDEGGNGSNVQAGNEPESSKTQPLNAANQDVVVEIAETASTDNSPKRGDEENATTPQKIAEQKDEKATTPKKIVKPEVDRAPSKGVDPSAAKVNAKLVRETDAVKKESKTAATTAGQNLLKRGTITLAGKDSEGSLDAPTEELFEALFRRFPRALCLKDLDYQTFKSKMLLANASGSQGGPLGAGAGGGGAKMEPIFAKITNEIKAVQITQSQYEAYTAAVMSCYETVIFDVMKDLDSMQTTVDKRLSSLERAVFLSEMRTKGYGMNPSLYSRVSRPILKAFSPFVAAAFQFRASPLQDPGVIFAGLFIVVLLLKFGHRRTAAKGGAASEAMGIHPATIDPRAMSPPPVDKSLVKERNDLAAQLSNKDEQMSKLQREHESLQKRYGELAQTISTLHQPSLVVHEETEDNSHVILNGGSFCSTPTPSVQSEPPGSSDVSPLTAMRSMRKSNLIGDSPLKKSRLRAKLSRHKINTR